MVLALVVLGLLLLRLESRADLLEAFSTALRRPAWVVAAILVFGACLLFGFARWSVLAEILVYRFRGREAFRLYALGHAMNLVTPGATGGDLFKAVAFAHNRRGERIAAVFSVFVDRISGLFWLLAMIAGMAAFRWKSYQEMPGADFLVELVLVILAIATVGALLIALLPGQERMIAGLSGNRKSKWRHVACELIRAAPFLLRHPRVFFLTALFSLGNHVGQVACAWCVARALGLPISWEDALLVFPLVTLLSSIPLTPGGLGVREAANQWLLGAWSVGAAEAMAVGLIVYGIMLGWAFAGVLWYAFTARKTDGRPGGAPGSISADREPRA